MARYNGWPPRVAKHRAHDFLALLHGLLDLGHILLEVGVALHGLARELVRHADDREQIVEVVRDAGGERAERLHFLAMHQVRLGHRKLVLLLFSKLVNLHVSHQKPTLPLSDENGADQNHQHTHGDRKHQIGDPTLAEVGCRQCP